MNVTVDQVQALLQIQRLTVPDADLKEIALRLSTWLTALEAIEDELGEAMNDVDPIPPVFVRPEI